MVQRRLRHHLCFGSTHTTDPSDPNTQFATGQSGITWPYCYMLTGLTPDQLARAGVRVGSTAVPVAGVRGPHFFGPPDDPLVSAWLFDNRGGSLTLLRLLQRIVEEKTKPPIARPVCVFSFRKKPD